MSAGLLVIAALAAGMGGGASYAAERKGGGFGPFTFARHASIEAVRDDNIYLSRTATTSSAIGKFSHDLTFCMEGKRLHLMFGYGF